MEREKNFKIPLSIGRVYLIHSANADHAYILLQSFQANRRSNTFCIVTIVILQITFKMIIWKKEIGQAHKQDLEVFPAPLQNHPNLPATGELEKWGSLPYLTHLKRPPVLWKANIDFN